MEAFPATQESENRITIGGKRKSSNRRSSILKATKSPLKGGVLEDLDPNSQDDNGSRSRSKKSRRSSGRRVSFAEKNDIKEFFVEDWKSSSNWTKQTEDFQVPNSAPHGEYRAPAESIPGLESLLKGEMCKAKVQEMPEVQYTHLSAANENKVSYDRGVLLQPVTHAPSQHTDPIDVTICHGPGIIGASHISHENQHTEQPEEMEYTKCHSSALPSDATNMDQTQVFSADTGIELDVTCSQQEIFFRDYPNAQLSSPDSLEPSGKMDSKSFLMSLGAKPSSSTSTSVDDASRKRQPLGEITAMQSSATSQQGGANQVSNFDDNVELTTCHSYKVLENSVPKTNRRSICEPVDIDVTSCYGTGLMQSPGEQGEVNVLRSQMTKETANLNVNRNSFGGDLPELSQPDYTAQLDVTNCYGSGILPGKRVILPGSDQTVVFNTDADNICGEPADLDVTSCYGQGLIKSPEKQILGSDKMDSSAFLKSLLATSETSATKGDDDNDDDDDEMDLTTTGHNGALIESKTTEQTQVTVSNLPTESTLTCAKRNKVVEDLPTPQGFRSAYLIKNPFQKSTDVEQPVTHFDENVEFTVCHSQPIQDNSMQQKEKRRSLYEPADIDVTSCYGAGLLQSQEKEGASNDAYKSVLNLSRSLQAASIANRNSGNTTLNRMQDSLQQQQTGFDENLELTKCHSGQFISSNKQKTHRRSLYEPADIDVTSCYGVGLVKLSGEDLEMGYSCNQSVLEKSSQKASRRSLYEPDDIDVTSCHGPGFVASSGEGLESSSFQSQPAYATISQKTNRKSLYEPADIDVTSCHGLGFVASSGESLESSSCQSQPANAATSQKTNRRSVYEPADIDVTSCHGPGFVASSGESLESSSCQSQPLYAATSQKTNRRSLYEPSDIDITSCHGPGLTDTQSQQVVDNNTQNANRRSLYESDDIDITSCHGPGLVNSSGEYLEKPALDSSIHRSSRQSFYESAELEVTSCHGAGLVKSFSGNAEQTVSSSYLIDDDATQKSRLSLYEAVDLEVTSCHGAGLVKSLSENSEPTVTHSHRIDDNTQQRSQQSLSESVSIDVTAMHAEEDTSNENGETGLNLTRGRENISQQSLSEPAGIDDTAMQTENVTRSNDGETGLDLRKGPDTTFHKVKEREIVEQEEKEIPVEEKLQMSSIAAGLNTSLKSTDLSDDIDAMSCHGPELNKSTDDQIIDRKLSIICEESVNELSRKEICEDVNVTGAEDMQDITQSPITLKEFLDLMEIAFIREVNVRRSIAPSDLAVTKAPQTPKDKIISTLVSKPKAACYEEAIPAIEAEMKTMRIKVEEQEIDLNVSNPAVFMEAQTASKEELLEMQNKVRRLRSMCEKTTKREWKEGKGQLNKKILSKITENHQALASDVHVVEESLSMVDDCVNLLDKMDNELDEGIQSILQTIEKNEKKLQEQATMMGQLEAMTEAVDKSEKELADLECKRSALQSEKQELVNRKEELDAKIIENEEAIRSLKSKGPRLHNATTKAMSQKFDILQSLQEWSLEEWNKERATFTFLKNTLEMVVLFGSEISESEDSSSNQEVKSIQLNFNSAEHFIGKMGKVHTLVKQAVNQDILTEMCHTKKDLTKVLEHMSEIVFKSNEIGKELFSIGLSHLMSFKDNRFVVEFSSLKAFLKFVLHIQLELQSYPDSVTFTVSPKIGHLSQAEIEETLHNVEAGPRYLRRLVEAADQLLNRAKPTS